MKGRAYLIIGVFIGSVCGWALGFLRLPLIGQDNSFWVGLLAGICLALLLFVLRSSFGRKTAGTASITKRAWIGGITIFLVSGGLMVATLIKDQNDEFLVQLMQKKSEFDQEQALVHAKQQANLGLVMESLFERIQEEVKTQNGSLSHETIGEIARISQSFEPYRYYPDISLNTPKLSPERGQLLLFLISSKMDTASFHDAISQATFAGADLEGANLARLNLRGIDLMGANLRDAVLNHVDLRDSDLRGANLWGAQMKRANLTGVDMRRADVRWADMEEATLRYALLDGADLSDALMRGVDMEEARFQFGIINGAMLYGANLVKTDFLKTSMVRIDVSEVNLSMANLQRTDLTEANFSGVKLEGVALQEEDWISKLAEWKVAGASVIRNEYIVTKDTVKRFHDVHYLLVRASAE